MTEVVTHLSVDMQEDLLKISVLDRFCAPLCDSARRGCKQ